MLRRLITYKDFDGKEHTELFYFNLTSAEMMELSVSRDGDLDAYIKRIVKEDNRPAIIAMVKDFILSSYGVKSEDGKSFIKSEEARTAFAQSAAYSALFVELFTDSTTQTAFVKSIIPPDWDEVRGKLEKAAQTSGGDSPASLPVET